MSLFLRPLRRFRRNRSGAVTVEFSMVALPFLAIVFAIVEGAVQQYFTSELDRITQSVAVAVRNGNLQVKNLNGDSLRAFYCPSLPGYIDCNKLSFSLQAASCRNDGACWAGAFEDRGTGQRRTPDLAAGPFNVGTVGQSQYLTVTYPLPVGMLVWDKSATATLNGERVRAIVSVATWVNDPSVQFF
jgi:Flp pilus assembly protein TadG